MPGGTLYTFGYGLSYTQFRYGKLSIDPAQIDTAGSAHVTVDVENTGRRSGTETVQLYVRERFAPVATAVKQLRAFDRVNLEPGEKRTVIFTLTSEDLKLLDGDMHWVVVPGTIDIMIGRSSADIAVKGELAVQESAAPGHK